MMRALFDFVSDGNVADKEYFYGVASKIAF